MTIVYQAASVDSHGPQIGLIRLRDHFMAQGHITVDNGIYAPRHVRGSTATWSTHLEGRAWDGIFDTQANLDAAINFLYEHREALQVQELISYHDEENRRWASDNNQSVNGGWQPYTHAGAPGWAFHFARNWQGAQDPRPIDEIVEVDMPLTETDITAVTLHVVDAVNKSLPALVSKAVVKAIDERAWFDGVNEGDPRRPGALYGALRKFLRSQR